MERQKISTSIDAYHSLKAEDVRAIYAKILAALKTLGSANTEVIANHLTMEHSKIHKRTSEMERLDMIYKPGTKSLMKSGRNGFNWCIKGTGTKDAAVETNYKKEKETSISYANKIIESAKGNGYIQNELFT